MIERIGRFDIKGEIGQGAMGTVYKAHDTVLDRLVALKTVTPSLLGSVDTVARFQREARAAARLQHPNIVTIYDLGEADGVLYIAMELLDGMDLAQAMAEPGHISRDRQLRIVVEISRGLDYAHKQGVFHRDVKPANVRLRTDGGVKLVDFGIARLADSTMTQSGLVLGTPSYIAPEVLTGARVDHRADMWAVGVILYELVSTRRPYESPTIAGLVLKIVHDPLPPIDSLVPGLPPDIVEIVTRALSKDPDGRFRDLAEMADAVEAALGVSHGTTPLPPPARERAYELNFAEARRLLVNEDLEGALAAARRALSLDPARAGVQTLVAHIEAQLKLFDTGRRTRPVFDPSPDGSALRAPSDAPTRVVKPLPRARSMSADDLSSPGAPGTTPDVSPSLAAAVEARGATALADLGTFGEAPSTQTVALSPVSSVLALSGSDGAIRLWDLDARRRVSVLRTDLHQRTGHDALALALAFSPDGSLLASGHVDGSVHLWTASNGLEAPARLRHDGPVVCLAFSPDGATLAAGATDASLRLWDVGSALSGECLRELFRQPAAVTSLAWVGGGDFILTGHTNRVLRLQDARTGRLMATLRGPEAQIHLLELSPDGSCVAVASHDRKVRFVDLDKRQVTSTIDGLRKPASGLAFSPEGEHIVLVTQENAFQVFAIRSGAGIATLWGQKEESFVGVNFLAHGDRIAVALADGRIRLYATVG